MPRKPPRICSEHGCNVRTTKGKCEQHRRTHGWQDDRYRGSRHDRGYGRQWEKDREETLKRDNYLCQPCLRSGRVTPATQVDHRIPKAAGGTDDQGNLQSICDLCHEQKTLAERAKIQKG